MKRALWAIPAVVLLVGLLAFGFGKNPSSVPDPLVGHHAPPFSLKTTAGRTISLASLRGHPLVMNFFASWCVSCKEQEANLVAAAHRWGSKARFVGVIYQDQSSPALGFTRSFGGSWPDLVDPSSRVAIDYGVTGIPETFFVNAHGVIISHSDSLTPAVLRSGITRIIGQHA